MPLSRGTKGRVRTSRATSRSRTAGPSTTGRVYGSELSGGLKRRGHPAIHAVFTAKQGESNTSKVNVTLPRGALLDNSHIKTVCTRVAFAADNCPSGSMIGRAQVSSPLLDQPLTAKCTSARPVTSSPTWSWT